MIRKLDEQKIRRRFIQQNKQLFFVRFCFARKKKKNAKHIRDFKQTNVSMKININFQYIYLVFVGEAIQGS